jgi:hypothetical protein
MCSHALALTYEAQARGMFGKEIREDKDTPHWLDSTIPVKQWGDWDRSKGRYSSLDTPDIPPIVAMAGDMIDQGEDPSEIITAFAKNLGLDRSRLVVKSALTIEAYRGKIHNRIVNFDIEDGKVIVDGQIIPAGDVLFPSWDPQLGLHVAGSLNAEGGWIDDKFVDYDKNRPRNDPKVTRPIKEYLPEAQEVAYSDMPFLNKLHQEMGANPVSDDALGYIKKRKSFFSSLPLENVPLDNIVITQPRVNVPTIDSLRKPPNEDIQKRYPNGPEPASLVRYNNQTWIIDGHHRTVADALEGKTTVPGHVWDLDAIMHPSISQSPYARAASYSNDADIALDNGAIYETEPVVTGVVREYATTPTGTDFFAGEADDLSKSYRDLPIVDPLVIPLWQNLGELMRQQAKFLSTIYTIERIDNRDPYATSGEMLADIANKKYQVTSMHSNHPVWDVNTNIAFRICHDIMGHGRVGSDFSLKGEIEAYQAQCNDVPENLWAALFTEIVAQAAYANTHHLFGEQKVGLIPLTQAQIQEHIDTVMDGPDRDYDAIHRSAAGSGNYGEDPLAPPGPFGSYNMDPYGMDSVIIAPAFDPAPLDDPLADDLTVVRGGEPEPALPLIESNDGNQGGFSTGYDDVSDWSDNSENDEDENYEDSSREASSDPKSRLAKLQAGMAWLNSDSPRGGNGGSDDFDISASAKAHLAKTSAKKFTPSEQARIIGEGVGVQASNLDRLDISGTHYEALEHLYDQDDEPYF